MKAGDRLRACDPCIIENDGKPDLTVGCIYTVRGVDNEDKTFFIIDDDEEEHWFDIEGMSTFFEFVVDKSAADEAKELVEKYKPYVYPYIGSSYMTGDEYPEQILKYAKQCAIIAVQEILAVANLMDGGFSFEKEIEYWQQVLNEIPNVEI